MIKSLSIAAVKLNKDLCKCRDYWTVNSKQFIPMISKTTRTYCPSTRLDRLKKTKKVLNRDQIYSRAKIREACCAQDTQMLQRCHIYNEILVGQFSFSWYLVLWFWNKHNCISVALHMCLYKRIRSYLLILTIIRSHLLILTIIRSHLLILTTISTLALGSKQWKIVRVKCLKKIASLFQRHK